MKTVVFLASLSGFLALHAPTVGAEGTGDAAAGAETATAQDDQDDQDAGSASKINSADITNISCNDSVVFQVFNNPPMTCSPGSEYDAGDVGIFRSCSYLSSGTLFLCSETFTESFLHRAVPGPTTCTDGGFVEQRNSSVQSNCPF